MTFIQVLMGKSIDTHTHICIFIHMRDVGARNRKRGESGGERGQAIILNRKTKNGGNYLY